MQEEGKRQVVVDTETTGLLFSEGDRVIEVGCVELVQRRVSGESFHRYVNPEGREISAAAQEVHGIDAEKLADKPVFKDVAEALLEFVRGAELIIHNAAFDLEFLNGEFARAGYGEGVVEAHCTVVDTLAMARSKWPGQANSLDALRKRCGVNIERIVHGAMTDAEILAEVYRALTAGQVGLLGAEDGGGEAGPAVADGPGERVVTPVIRASAEEVEAHEKWLRLLDEEGGGAVWRGVEGG